MRMALPRLGARRWWLVAGILLIAANLRAPMTGMPPLLEMIQASFGLSTVQLGLLTTLPLAALAVVSPMAAGVARHIGIERALFLGLALIAAGIVVRSSGFEVALYVGTFMLGAGIAFGNVLLPGLLKRDFTDHIAALTGAYAITMGIAAALASSAVVPFAMGYELGWSLTLLGMIVLPMVGMALWWPQCRTNRSSAAAVTAPPSQRGIWRVGLAWQVTLFIALNSYLYYVLIGWLPLLLTDAGYSATTAGSLHGMMQLMAALPGLFMALLLRRLPDQSSVAVITSLLVAVGFLGLWLTPQWAVFWVALFGAASGGGMILGLILVSLRSSSPLQAAALAGMAQTVAYTLAAIAPTLMGWIYDRSSGWTLPLVLSAMTALIMAYFGAAAGRNRVIGAMPSVPRS